MFFVLCTLKAKRRKGLCIDHSFPTGDQRRKEMSPRSQRGPELLGPGRQQPKGGWEQEVRKGRAKRLLETWRDTPLQEGRGKQQLTERGRESPARPNQTRPVSIRQALRPGPALSASLPPSFWG